MAIERGFRFPIEQDVAFPRGLVLMGEIEPDNEYQSAEDRGHNRPVVQRKDERTGKLVWKGTLTDPSEKRSKRAAFDVRFVAAVQPIPTTDEVIPGIRPIELDGLEVEPKVGGQGEFKYLTYDVWATGIKDSGRGRGRAPGSGAGSSSVSADPAKSAA